MARRVSIGYQEFEDIIINDLFYVDKTQLNKIAARWPAKAVA